MAMLDLVPELGWITIALVMGLWILSRTIGLPWLGRVSHFADGDSVESKAWTRTYRVRIRGLDAPEYKQDYGTTARQALVDLIGQDRVLFIPFGTDRHRRLLCWVVCRRGLVNWIMVWRGHAWYGSLATWFLHQIPRMLRRGLWASTIRVRPDSWRRYGQRMSYYVPQSPPRPDAGRTGKGRRGGPRSRGNAHAGAMRPDRSR